MGKMLPRKMNWSWLLLGLAICCCITSEIVAAADLDCYHCDGDDCEDPVVTACPTATQNDQCYVRLNKNNDIIGMGCASALGAQEVITNLIKNKELYVCSTTNCNGFENLPDSNECTKCDSLTDEKCATQPKLAGTKTRCGVVPYTQCYERVSVANGKTERGCVMDLESDDFYNCLSGQDKNCKLCGENGCNIGIVPASRTQCHRCDSATDSSCSNSPSALTVCPTYFENDACVSQYNVSGVTKRGCASELGCNTTERNCQICTSSGCNIADMKVRSEQLYGIFQDLPLNCYTCAGEECKSGRKTVRKCQGNIYQDCLSVFDTDGILVAAGCEDALATEYLTHCDTNTGLCFNCKSNGCNDLNAVPKTVDCLYCDTATNSDCLTNVLGANTRSCVEGCVTKLYENKSNANLLELARTCFEDLDIDDREICTKENDCVKCTDEECNTDIIPAEGRLSCLHCDGVDCDDPKSKLCSSYWSADQCYIYFDAVTHSAVQMGCKSSLPVGEILNDALHYFVCDGDDCNSYENLPEANFCYVCSSADNEDCIEGPNTLPTTRCQINPHTDCYKRITDDGLTERGCISALNNTDFLKCHQGTPGNYCTICTESYCNDLEYPYGRLSCHRCNSLDDPSCETNPNAVSNCPIFEEDEVCVSKWIDGIVYRGCGTELQCEPNSTYKTCRTCDDYYCNTDVLEGYYPIGDPGLFQDVPLNCYECDGAAACANGMGKLQKCDGDIYQTCTTVFSRTNGTVIGRGCSDKHVETCNNETTSNCYNCKSNGCNVATDESKYIDCIFCDGRTKDDCIDNVDAVRGTRKCYESCVTTLYNRTNAVNSAREVIRTCLDDLDLDVRESCAAGKDENCKACSENKCNTDVIGEHLSCYQCVGDECQVPTVKRCHAVSATDQCTVRYDERRSIVELGCKSNYDADELKELIVAKLLWLCDGENCNTIDASPASQVCSVCSSLTNENCAKAPSKVVPTTSCAKVPYTQCYSRVLDSGHTERGCVSSVEGDDFYDCIMGTNSTKCLTCLGNKCNSEVFPANRRSCHQCDSTNNLLCESSPESSAICLLYHSDEACTTKLINGETYRGCSSDHTCDGLDKNTCRECAGKDNCNIVDLSSKNIGAPGKWQDLPLNCYDCEGDECANSNGKLRKCQSNNLQTCQTVFGSNDRVERRGCSDEVESTYESYCDEYPGKCLGCKSSGCNNATSLDQYIDCYRCDAAENPNCGVGFEGVGPGAKTRKCQGYCAVALYPRSSAPSPAYELARTCLDDLELDDREECLAGEHEFCTACDGDLCNFETIPENRHKCYHCADEECADYEIKECSAYKKIDQCYISFDAENSIKGMGCRSEFEEDVVELLIKQKKFKFCEGEACNGPETIAMPKVCAVCDSKIDPYCAISPNLVTEVERCVSLPYTDCYTRVKEDGHTTRGCLATLEPDTFYGCLMGNDELCQTCADDKCNSYDVFPADRWKCQQCNSEDNEFCASAPISNKVCPIYSESDSCVTNYKDGVTTRGCASNFQCDESSDNSTCRTCNTTGCNTINLDRILSQGRPGRWQDVPITCLRCEGEEDCAGASNYRACTGNLYQSCMTIFNAAGSVIQRGCSDALEDAYYDLCEQSPGNCPRCNSNGCNNATQLTDYIDCLFCDESDKMGNCVLAVGEVRKTRKCNKYCMTALYPKYDEWNPAYGLTRSCFDDMDLDERVACQSGELEHCEVCASDKCNTQVIPAQRFSCLACVNGDCQDPQPTTCVNYRPVDQCYIQFDEERSVTAMGCRSEFSNEQAKYEISQKRLYFCDGENCNTYDSIPETQTCRLCNSRTDINCAISPSELTSYTRCARTPYTECYTRVLPSGYTERGCLSSLYDDEFVSCWNGTSNTCHACKGDYCNEDLYPEDRISCHICDSATDPRCAYKPEAVGLCPVYAKNDSCVTAYINDTTWRGCSSSIRCDATQTKTCEQCEGEACNTVNLERKQDTNYGKWQDLPLSCLSCSGAACASSNVESFTCTNNNEQDCMTVFDDNKQVVRRGCSDIVYDEFLEHCNEDWTKCPSCKSKNCNNATSLSQYNTCIYCDTNKDQTCIWDATSSTHKTRACQGACMTVLYPSDGGIDPAYELMRTCLDDKEAKDQLTCANGKDGKCQSCIGNKCNTAQIPADRHSCYQCLNDDCEEPQLQICPLYKSGDQCFTQFDADNTVIQMGCLSSFHNQLLENLIGTKRIRVCDGVGCNTLDALPIAHTCAVCNSNEDYSCATNAAETGSFSTCSQYPYTDCYTKLDTSDGSTKRGCLADLPTTDFVNCVLGNNKNCTTCIGDGCNREIFPADRQQCYICSSDDDADCTSKPSRLLPCPYATAEEKCRTAYGGNETIRGCSSEVFCDTNDRRTCRDCSGTACNDIDLSQLDEDDGYYGWWQDLPLRCHTCEGEHCAYSLGPAYNCSGSITQDCATVFTTDGEIKRRGCADDVEDYEQRYCREHPHLCFKCKSNECNDAWNIDEYVQCNYCISDEDGACTVDPANSVFAKRQCKQECMVALKGTQTIRSCLDDKEENQRYICRANEGGNQCASCNTDDCNDFGYPKDRLSCHVCNDTTCSTSVPRFCSPYSKDDYCFAKYENGNVEVMGCASSQNGNDLAEWAAQRKLYACRGNNCNDPKELPKTGGRCLSCNSAIDSACVQNPFGYVVTEMCPPLENECVTFVDAAGHTQRGCLSKLADSEQKSCEASGKCAICTGDNCNNEIFPSNRLSCHICNSSSDPNCARDPNHIQVCPIYANNDRCVTKFTPNIERGCQSQLTCDTNDENSCQICDGNGCNIAELTDAALITTASLLTTLIAAILVVLGHRFN